MKKNRIKILLLAIVALGLAACNGSDASQDLPTESNNSQTQNAPNETDDGQYSNAAENEEGVPAWMLDLIPESSRDAFSEAFLEAGGSGGAFIFSPETGETFTGDEALEMGREAGIIPENSD